MSSNWPSILLFLPLLQVDGADEDTSSLDIVDKKGVMFDYEGKYVNTESVWMYVVIFSAVLSVVMVAGCINLCWIRWHYRRKCAEIISRLEQQHKRKMETQGDPSPFGVPIRAAGTPAPPPPPKPTKPKEATNIVWDPAALAQVLHHLLPDQTLLQSTGQNPYPGITLVCGDTLPAPKDTDGQGYNNCVSTVGQSSGVQAGSHA